MRHDPNSDRFRSRSPSTSAHESFAEVWRASGFMVLPIACAGAVLAGVFALATGTPPDESLPPIPSENSVEEQDVLPPLRDALSAAQFAQEIEAELERMRLSESPILVTDEPRPCEDPANCPEVVSCQITAQVRTSDEVPAEAHLSLSRVDHLGRIATWNAVTGADGVHRFSALPAGEYHLTVDVEGAALQSAPPYVCQGDGARAFFNLHVAKTFVPFRGTLVGHGGAAPAGASVLLEQPSAAVTEMLGVAHLAVDASGVFAANLAPGRYRLVAKAPHHQATFRDFEIRADDTRAKTHIRLDWKPTARGVVAFEDGRPAAGVHVYLGPIYSPKVGYTAVVTDAEGKFELPLIAGQRHTVTAFDPSAGLATVNVRASTRTNGVDDVKIVLKPGRSYGGVVLTTAGKPHAFGEVRYRVKELGIQGIAKTDEEGRFVVENAPKFPMEMWPEDGALGAWGGGAATPTRPRVLLTYQAPAY